MRTLIVEDSRLARAEIERRVHEAINALNP